MLSSNNFKNTTILITGGAGFIGSNLVFELLKLEAKVIIIDNFTSSYNPVQKEKNILRFIEHPHVKLLRGDILDEKILSSLKKIKINTVIHLAALAGVRNSVTYPENYYKVNVIGTLRLLEFVRDKNIQQFIFASSSSVYGADATIPFKEDQILGIPTSPYAASKVAAESLCQSYHFLYGIPTTIFRLFSVYGPHGRPDMAPYIFAHSILTGKPITVLGSPKKIKRDYTYVMDVVDGFISALSHPLQLEIINLGSTKPIMLSHLIQELEKNLNQKVTIHLAKSNITDLRITYASIEKAKKLLNWQPQTSFSEGIQQFCEWLKTENISEYKRKL